MKQVLWFALFMAIVVGLAAVLTHCEKSTGPEVYQKTVFLQGKRQLNGRLLLLLDGYEKPVEAPADLYEAAEPGSYYIMLYTKGHRQLGPLKPVALQRAHAPQNTPAQPGPGVQFNEQVIFTDTASLQINVNPNP